MTRDELVAALYDADALICLLSDKIDDELLEGAPRLGIVANHAVGLDNVDLAAARRRGVAVTNTPDVLTEATADLTLALLLAVARRVVEADGLARSGAWRGWEPDQLLGVELAGRTLGIVGMGRIGRAVARRAAGFGLRVIYSAPREAAGVAAPRLPLDALLAEADLVSLHVPLTGETRGLLGRRELSLMKPGAILVNTARGACVDEAALIEALDAGRLGGAGLDVYAEEPAIPEALRRQRRA